MSGQKGRIHRADGGTDQEVGLDPGLHERNDASRLQGTEISPTRKDERGLHVRRAVGCSLEDVLVASRSLLPGTLEDASEQAGRDPSWTRHWVAFILGEHSELAAEHGGTVQGCALDSRTSYPVRGQSSRVSARRERLVVSVGQ